MLHDFERHQLQRHWAVEPAPSDLADRIIAHALTQPQRQPLLMRLRSALQSWSAIPQSSLAMRGLAVAACVMIAVVAFEGSSVTGTDSSGKTVKYVKPMDQIVEEMLWNSYEY